MFDKQLMLDIINKCLEDREQLHSNLQEQNSYSEKEDIAFTEKTQKIIDLQKNIVENDFISKDDYLRLAADFDNYKKRSIIQQKQVAEGVSMDIIESLLPVIDDMERVLSPIKITNESLIEQGVRLIYNNLLKIFADEGCKKIDVIPGNKFDPAVHEAISVVAVNAENGYEIDQITEVYQSGWTFNGKLLRAAKVAVAGDGKEN